MGGEGIGDVIIEFDLTAFTLVPMVEVINTCRKKDLVLIADFFDIKIIKDSTKQVLKENLYEIFNETKQSDDIDEKTTSGLPYSGNEDSGPSGSSIMVPS